MAAPDPPPKTRRPPFLLLVRYFERPHDPPRGLKWIEITKPATLGQIADDYDILWTDLALYNWQTTDLDEINWYLAALHCTQHNGKWYSFSGTEKAHLLVPDIPPVMAQPPGQPVAVPRGGKAKHDTRLQVSVVEWVRGGKYEPVSGKWLYVFSGSGGTNFGSLKSNHPYPGDGPRETPDQGPAFGFDFPGAFPIAKNPDKLEYEILVTADEPVDSEMMKLVTGHSDPVQPPFKTGANWYVLSDPTILKNSARGSHLPHKLSTTKAVQLEFDGKKRYYFLLSPVQLGPAALQLAMNNPQGLTPLLKPRQGTLQWGVTSFAPPKDVFVGPSAEDFDTGAVVLPVIDPYAWAESIAEGPFQDAINVYTKWLGTNPKSGIKNETLATLQHATSWTADEYYVAKILAEVAKVHPKPLSIDNKLKQPVQWHSYVQMWDFALTQRDEEIRVNAHRALIELISWMTGPAHGIIETAILKDTNSNSSQDAIDRTRGLQHWSICTEFVSALQLGVLFLQKVFSQPGSVPSDFVFQDLNLDGPAKPISKTNVIAYRYSGDAVLQLLGLKDFISPLPKDIPQYQASRREHLIQLLNESKILPGQVRAPELMNPPRDVPKAVIVGTGLNSLLDVGDKFLTWTVDEGITTKGKFGLNWLENLRQFFKRHPKIKAWRTRVGSGLKGVAFIVNAYNLFEVFTSARYDYQSQEMTVTKRARVGAVTGLALAVQEAAAELAKRYGSKTLQRILPQFIDSKAGPAWGVGVVENLSWAGKIFAGVNVVAIILAGALNVWLSTESALKSRNLGDYGQAKIYLLGAVGGLATAGAGFALAYALMVTGIATAWTTVGVLLLTLGAILSIISSFLDWIFPPDDPFQTFAGKCFLGIDGADEPRFGSDAPGWSGVLEEGANTWPVLQQKVAIHNLIGQFQVKTFPQVLGSRVGSLDFNLKYEMTPGVITPGSTIEINIEDENKSKSTTPNPADRSLKLMWLAGESPNYRVITRGSRLYDEPKITIEEDPDGGAKKVTVTITDQFFSGIAGKLLTNVTLKYPDLPNVIKLRKLVMSPGDGGGGPLGHRSLVQFDDNTPPDSITSAIFGPPKS